MSQDGSGGCFSAGSPSHLHHTVSDQHSVVQLESLLDLSLGRQQHLLLQDLPDRSLGEGNGVRMQEGYFSIPPLSGPYP